VCLFYFDYGIAARNLFGQCDLHTFGSAVTFIIVVMLFKETLVFDLYLVQFCVSSADGDRHTGVDHAYNLPTGNQASAPLRLVAADLDSGAGFIRRDIVTSRGCCHQIQKRTG